MKTMHVATGQPSVMPCPPTKDEAPGFKSFFRRYWQFVIWGIVFLGLVLNNEVFKFLGALTYLPLLSFGVFILAFILRHILHRTSTDAYIEGDAYDTDFASLPAIHKVWLTQVQFFVYILVIAILASKVMGDEAVVHPKPTATPTIRPEWTGRLDVVITGIVRNRDRYLVIEHQRLNGMPWFYVAGIHERESSRNFTCHLSEGSPLIHRTIYVPKGRLPYADPPYTFEQGAEDALYVLEHENVVNWSDYDASLYAIEAYNGLGYKLYHPDVKSPYVWSGTSLYTRGKYTSDGRFSRISVDQQVGVEAIRMRMKERGIL